MEQSKPTGVTATNGKEAVILQIARRLTVTATVPGSGETTQLVADVVLREWEDWITAHHPDVWKRIKPDLDDVNTKIVNRTLELIEHSRQFRDKLLGNEGRDVMRSYMLRWVADEYRKVAPALFADRLLPRHFLGA